VPPTDHIDAAIRWIDPHFGVVPAVHSQRAKRPDVTERCGIEHVNPIPIERTGLAGKFCELFREHVKSVARGIDSHRIWVQSPIKKLVAGSTKLPMVSLIESRMPKPHSLVKDFADLIRHNNLRPGQRLLKDFED
jgi:hypothetical protein